MEHALLCRHRVVQHPQVYFSALSVAEVRLSSGENETTPNCSTWVGSASAGKKKTDIHKSVIFAAKYCGFQSSRICETKNYRYPFSLRVQLVKFFLLILMLKVCRLKEFSAWNVVLWSSGNIAQQKLWRNLDGEQRTLETVAELFRVPNCVVTLRLTACCM